MSFLIDKLLSEAGAQLLEISHGKLAKSAQSQSPRYQRGIGGPTSGTAQEGNPTIGCP